MVDNAGMDSALGQISIFAIGYAVLVALASLGIALSRRPRPTWLDSMVWFLEALLVLRVVAGAGAMMGGQRPDEGSAHIGYLVASVCIMPIALSSFSGDRGPWSSAVLSVSALAVAVVGVRLMMTWA